MTYSLINVTKKYNTTILFLTRLIKNTTTFFLPKTFCPPTHKLICVWSNRPRRPEVRARRARACLGNALVSTVLGAQGPRYQGDGHGASAVSTTSSALPGTGPPVRPPQLCSGPGAAAHVLPHLIATGAGVRNREGLGAGLRESAASAVLGKGPLVRGHTGPSAAAPWQPSSVCLCNE